MKKIFSSILLTIYFFSFGQTNEINQLTKIINENRLTENYLIDYIRISKALDGLANNESTLLYANFFKTKLPLIYIEVKGKNTLPESYSEIVSPYFITKYLKLSNEIIALEQKSGNKLLTDKLLNEKEALFTLLNNFTNQLIENENFKDASQVLFNLASYEINNIEAEIEVSNTTNSRDFKQLEIKREVIYKNELLKLERAYSLNKENPLIIPLLNRIYQVLKMNNKIITLNK
jgi:hypothetical protein